MSIPDKGGERGLSNQDYVSFLTHRRQVMTIICFRGGIMFNYVHNLHLHKNFISSEISDEMGVWCPSEKL